MLHDKVALSVSQHAPLFSLPDQHGQVFSLLPSISRWTVIYFYPKAMTPGCTTQACALKGVFPTLTDMHVRVVGISTDSQPQIQAFAQRDELPFTLLADVDHQVAGLYNVWRQKSMYGKTFWGVARTTYLLDENLVIQAIWDKVDPKTHHASVLQWIKEHAI